MKIRPGFFNTCVKIKPKRFFEKSTITLTEVSHTNSSTRFVFSLSVVNTGVTCDQVQFLTHERIHAYAHSAQRCVHLATPSAIDGRFSPHDKSKESPMLPSTVRCLLVSPPVNPPERAQGWLGSGKRARARFDDSRRHHIYARLGLVSASFSLSVSLQSEYERGSPQTVIRLTEMGCWFGNPGAQEAPGSTMTVFNQENVEDYYEIGDELGRYVMFLSRFGVFCLM